MMNMPAGGFSNFSGGEGSTQAAPQAAAPVDSGSYYPQAQAQQAQQFNQQFQQGSSLPQGYMPQAPDGASQFGSDIADLQGRLQESHEQFGAQGQELALLREQLDGNNGTLEALRQALGGKAAEKPVSDPTQRWRGQLDNLLSKALEADRMGQPIPLTANIGVDFYEDKIASHARNETMAGEMAELREHVKRLSDPSLRLDDGAYIEIDSQLRNSMNSLYGIEDQYKVAREAQLGALSSQVGNHIKQLRDQNPDLWDQTRRNPAMIKRLVNFHVQNNLPPKVVQQMEQEKLQNTPLTQTELSRAFQEAAQIPDPQQRAQVQTRIRQELLSAAYAQGQRR